MPVLLELVPWGVTVFTLLGLAFALGTRLSQLETKVDLLYEIYVREKLRQQEKRGKAAAHSPYRLTAAGRAQLDPMTAAAVCEGPRHDMGASFRYIATHPVLRERTETEARAQDLPWGELLTAYALYAVESDDCPPEQGGFLRRLWRALWALH